LRFENQVNGKVIFKNSQKEKFSFDEKGEIMGKISKTEQSKLLKFSSS